MLIFLKFKLKHPKLFKFLTEGKLFLLIFVVAFAAVFAIFNGRSFSEQTRYFLKINIEETKKFLARLPEIKEDLYDVPNSIIIPKINIDAPIVSPQTTDEKIIFNQLENGTVLYPTYAMPGQKGSTIILGHSSAYPWYKGQYGSVFSLLNHLALGDEIIVFYNRHKYVYQVSEQKVINKNVILETQNEKAEILLISCWPVGTAWKRIMIKAVLSY